jgi:hypothetical protein
MKTCKECIIKTFVPHAVPLSTLIKNLNGITITRYTDIPIKVDPGNYEPDF